MENTTLMHIPTTKYRASLRILRVSPGRRRLLYILPKKHVQNVSKQQRHAQAAHLRSLITVLAFCMCHFMDFPCTDFIICMLINGFPGVR